MHVNINYEHFVLLPMAGLRREIINNYVHITVAHNYQLRILTLAGAINIRASDHQRCQRRPKGLGTTTNVEAT